MRILVFIQPHTNTQQAIPTLTNQFHSFGDIGWYGSAYLLTSCSLQIFFGRLYTFYNPKWLYMTFIVFFEVGSVISGAAPNSIAFIWGRAIAGAASAGVQNGSIVVMMSILPLHKRPIFQGIFGAIFGISSVVGPIIGGAFTSDVTWRWCFYLNLPLGGAALAVCLFFLRIPESFKPKNRPAAKEQLYRLDPIGTLLSIATIVCLLLALQWGGSTYPWSDGRIIALFVCFGVGLVLFVTSQIVNKKYATIPSTIAKNRTVIACSWFTFCLAGVLLTLAYWLPIWFQAIKGASAVRSGILFLPLLLCMVVFSILTGVAIKFVGYYTPFMIAAACIAPIGSGLITTFKVDSGSNLYLGYQCILGIGMGLGLQVPTLAVQNVLAKKDAPTGVALQFFFNTLSGTIFVSVGQAILNNKLAMGLATIPNLTISPSQLAQQGATDLRGIVPASQLGMVLQVYNAAITNIFYICVGLSCAMIVGAVFVDFKKIQKPPAAKPKAAEQAAEEGAVAAEAGSTATELKA